MPYIPTTPLESKPADAEGIIQNPAGEWVGKHHPITENPDKFLGELATSLVTDNEESRLPSGPEGVVPRFKKTSADGKNTERNKLTSVDL